MNMVTIEPTKFENVRTGEISYGYRMYDDYGQCYDNTLESIPDDDMEIFKEVLESENETEKALISFVQEQCSGISIGHVFYGYSELAKVAGWEETNEHYTEECIKDIQHDDEYFDSLSKE